MNHREERQIIFLLKIVGVLVIILILTDMISCIHAKAGVVTGEKHLGGLSKAMEDTEYTVYPEGICLLAEVMWHENGCNGEEVMYYTGAVVMNRVRNKWFPNTVKEVLYQTNPRQYSTTDKFFTKELPESVYHLAAKVAKGTPDVPEGVLYQAMFKQGKVWKRIPSSYSEKDIEYFCFGR